MTYFYFCCFLNYGIINIYNFRKWGGVSLGTYIKDVSNSLNNYNQARLKRKELFGPTLFDTALEVGEITYNRVRERVIDLTESFKEKHGQKFEESLDSIRKTLAKNYNKHFRGKLTKFSDLFRTEAADAIINEDEQLKQFKERLTKDSKKPIKVANKPKKEVEFLDEQEQFSAKQFAKMYHRSDNKASIKEDIVNGKDYNEVVQNVIHTNNLHYGPFKSSIAVFFDTLKSAKPLNYEQMDAVTSDVEELDNIDIQIEELQSKIDELQNRKTTIEDKYELVTPKERVRSSYMNLLENSAKFIDVQTKFADELDIDKEVLQLNARVTREEMERIEAEKEADFDEYLVKEDSVDNISEDNIDKEVHKELVQIHEINFATTLDELNVLEREEYENFVNAINDLDEDIKPVRKNMYTRKN